MERVVYFYYKNKDLGNHQDKLKAVIIYKEEKISLNVSEQYIIRFKTIYPFEQTFFVTIQNP